MCGVICWEMSGFVRRMDSRFGCRLERSRFVSRVGARFSCRAICWSARRFSTRSNGRHASRPIGRNICWENGRSGRGDALVVVGVRPRR